MGTKIPHEHSYAAMCTWHPSKPTWLPTQDVYVAIIITASSCTTRCLMTFLCCRHLAGPPSAAGWRIKSLTVARECKRSVLPTYVQDINEFLNILNQQANSSDSSSYPEQLFYGDQSALLQAHIDSGWDCPVFDNDATKQSYTTLVDQTYSSYKECANSSVSHDGYRRRDVDALLNPVNITCLLDSVSKLTTATISVIITVQRTTTCERIFAAEILHALLYYHLA